MTEKIYQSPRDLYLQRHGCDDLYEEREDRGRQAPSRFKIVSSLLLLVIGFGVGYGFYWFRLQGLM